MKNYFGRKETIFSSDDDGRVHKTVVGLQKKKEGEREKEGGEDANDSLSSLEVVFLLLLPLLRSDEMSNSRGLYPFPPWLM